MQEFDVVIIGSGPGGYVGAIRAAQLGLKTAVIEKDPTFGGTCLNVGCIPSKALLQSSELFHQAQHSLKTHGIETGTVGLNLGAMMERKSKIVKELTSGIGFLFDKNKIVSFKGLGRIESPSTVSVTTSTNEVQTLAARHIVIATGSVPNTLKGIEIDGQRILTSTEALSLTEVPEHLVVIGAGAIGLEMGSVWARLGSRVTVVEYGPQIAGSADSQLAKRFQQILKKQGLEFLLNSEVKSVQVTGQTVQVRVLSHKSQEETHLDADRVLVAAGRRPFTDGLGLERVGLKTNERGAIPVNHHCQTDIPNVWAIGDAVPGPMLAHKAEEEGVMVAELIAGRAGHVNYKCVPSVIYTEPELASVGLTEEQLKKAGRSYKAGSFPFTPNGRAKAMGTTEGMVKVLADEKTDELLGVHILGPHASDLIHEAVVTMEFGGSSEDLARCFHAHPTLSEVVREAALAVDGRARQM